MLHAHQASLLTSSVGTLVGNRVGSSVGKRVGCEKTNTTNRKGKLVFQFRRKIVPGKEVYTPQWLETLLDLMLGHRRLDWLWARSLGGELAEESKTDNVSQRLISCFTTTFCFSRHRFILLTDLSTKNTTAEIASRVQKQKFTYISRRISCRF